MSNFFEDFKTPEEILTIIKKWLTKQHKLAIISTFIAGMLIHIPLYVNQFTNPDGVWFSVFRNDYSWETRLGRWFLEDVERAKCYMVLPAFTTGISIFLISLTVMFIVDLFKIKNSITIVLTGILFVAYPVIANSLTYFYCSNGYMLSMLLAVLAVWCATTYKSWGSALCGAICMIYSMALYQSYIGITVALCLLIIIYELLENKQKFKEILHQAAKYLIMGITAGIGYYISVQVNVKMLNLQITSYRGIDNMGQIDVLEIPNTIIVAYTKFFDFFFKDTVINNSWWNTNLIYGAIMTFGIIMIIGIAIKNRLHKQTIRLITTICMIFLIPLGFGFVSFFTVNTEVTILMLPQMLLIVIFILVLSEDISVNKKLVPICWIVIYFVGVLAFRYCIMTNTIYLGMQITYNKSYALAGRILDRIEQHSEYKPGMKVLIVGKIDNNNYIKQYEMVYKATRGTVTDWSMFWDNNKNGHQGTWHYFFKYYLGASLNGASAEEYGTIVNKEEFINMKLFPAADSIRVIDEVMVIKLEENEL